MYICIHVHMYMCIYMYMEICTFVCAYIRIHVYIYIYIHTYHNKATHASNTVKACMQNSPFMWQETSNWMSPVALRKSSKMAFIAVMLPYDARDEQLEIVRLFCSFEFYSFQDAALLLLNKGLKMIQCVTGMASHFPSEWNADGHCAIACVLAASPKVTIS